MEGLVSRENSFRQQFRRCLRKYNPSYFGPEEGTGSNRELERIDLESGNLERVCCDLVKNYSFCWILFYVSKIVYTLLFLFTILYSISYTASLVILERYE